MDNKIILPGAVLLFVLAATAAFAGGPTKAKMLARLPAAVQQTIRAQLGEGKLNSVEKEAEDGQITYDVAMTRGGRTREFTVGAGGELLERQVFLEELPPPVQKAIQVQAGQGTLGDIYKSTEDGETSYDAEVTSVGQTRGFTVNDEGSLLSMELFLAELPSAVQQTIEKQTGGVAPDEIDKSFDDGQVTYDVEMTIAGRTRDFTVSPAGELLDQQVFFNELPAALQTAVNQERAGARIGEIYKSVDDGQVSYDVELTQAGQSRTVTFDPGGRVLSQERPVRFADAPDAVQKALRSLGASGATADISEVTEDNAISYDVDLNLAGHPKSFSMAVDGKIIPDDN